eukprot:CAMPEP_0194079028 /NCGR_PEP_ID=MMETSP0149-20130528/5279_1 /TAXON_ID=122233 /ORGANISM="Chaetoceros debilis, Strain MM31A-1" /LENGTH=509 /DNA_ID=CAMNT_0038760389 /DNA_START=61 /DNA_END=1587 /DNA_ORIENTATION=-
MTEIASNPNILVDNPAAAVKDPSCVPSGFVLKLYQMVNGAPDEVVAWTGQGDAFRISDLNRLENETLPTYFRHRRFQSLVRQLNFYNFRKVNRERNFWVYKHPLFHRERPGDLHLLRRRTCPGVDGRKIKPEVELSSIDVSTCPPAAVPVSADSSVAALSQSDSDDADLSLNSSIKKPIETEAPVRKKRKYTKRKTEVNLSLADDRTALKVANSEMFPTYIRDDSEAAKKMVAEEATIPAVEVEDWVSTADKYMSGRSRLVSPMAEPKIAKADLMEQSLLVSKVARQLEEHAKRAAGRLGKKRLGNLGAMSATSQQTLKYHSLTYDDEVEIFDSIRGCVVERTFGKKDAAGEESSSSDDDNSESHATTVSLNDNDSLSPAAHVVLTVPVNDVGVIEDIAKKLLNGNGTVSRDAQLTIAIAKFCMRTDPKDPLLGKKAVQLMSVHADLAHEFCLYQIALSPNHKLSMADQHSRFMKDIFDGECVDIVRGFKTFVLNNLSELVRFSKSVAW